SSRRSTRTSASTCRRPASSIRTAGRNISSTAASSRSAKWRDCRRMGLLTRPSEIDEGQRRDSLAFLFFAASAIEDRRRSRSSAMAVREHYIPLRLAELIDVLSTDVALDSEEQDAMRRWCTLLSATLHFRYQQFREKVKGAYAPFDPDAVTVPLQAPT